MTYKFNNDEINIEVIDGHYNVTIDDESETYKAILEHGRSLKQCSSDEEAFEVGMKDLLDRYIMEHSGDK